MKQIELLFLLFITYSCIGWIIETSRISIRSKEFINRGFLIGPYCPIYGVCSIMMLLTLGNITNPIILFLLATIICSIVEYITSYFMERIFNARWWDYSQYKFNINGRICLKNAILFGLLGLFLIFILNPFIMNVFIKMNYFLLNALFIISFSLFVLDFITSYSIILKLKDLSLKYVNLDNTKEIAKIVKEAIRESWVFRRIFHAYPNLKITIMDKINNIKKINPLPKIKNKR